MKNVVIVFIVALVLLARSNASAQLTQPSGGTTSLPTPVLQQSGFERNLITPSPDAMIFDGVIDPAEYMLGPGDILQYRSWTNNEGLYLLVSADRQLVIPRIGEFSVVGKTFDQVKQEVFAAARKSFRSSGSASEFSLTLAQPRRIAITVLGEVEQPGVYTFTSGTRADVAVQIANIPSKTQTIIADEARMKELDKRKRDAERIKPYLGNEQDQTRSRRFVTVRHTDGTSERVDLARFVSTRDPKSCPLLREGDVVYVPFRRPTQGAIGVYGAVIAPQDFEFVEGDKLWEAIRMAFGPTDNARLDQVELVRMSPDGQQAETQLVNAAAIRDGASPDIPLQAGDRIFVREKVDQRELSRVIIKGEVQRPGVYPIHRTNTRLSEVIKLAGGFTPYAFLSGGTVIRKKLDIDNKDITTEEEAKLVGRVANLTVVDTANFRFQTEVREGYVAVNMNKLFNGGGSEYDITLRDGDVISIPASPTTVYVWGYVGSVGHIPYRPGAGVEHYIQAAGGYSEGAHKSKTRVIKVRTRQWLDPDDAEIEPGDEIYVPPVGMYPEDYTLRTTQTIVSISSALLGIALAIISLTRN
jgi:protein involved in polysaccharide export with SLBB domain